MQLETWKPNETPFIFLLLADFLCEYTVCFNFLPAFMDGIADKVNTFANVTADGLLVLLVKFILLSAALTVAGARENCMWLGESWGFACLQGIIYHFFINRALSQPHDKNKRVIKAFFTFVTSFGRFASSITAKVANLLWNEFQKPLCKPFMQYHKFLSFQSSSFDINIQQTYLHLCNRLIEMFRCRSHILLKPL